jgi:hypothetical protein
MTAMTVSVMPSAGGRQKRMEKYGTKRMIGKDEKDERWGRGGGAKRLHVRLHDLTHTLYPDLTQSSSIDMNHNTLSRSDSQRFIPICLITLHPSLWIFLPHMHIPRQKLVHMMCRDRVASK